jgi:hypothetical protein
MIRIVTALVLLGMVAHATTRFDLSSEFSPKKNPRGVWQYGYSATRSLDPSQFRSDKATGALGAIQFWHPTVSDRPGPGYYPYVAHNGSKQSQFGSSHGWAVRAGEIAMEGSNTGQYSIVRFVAPLAGVYKVTAHFAGVHFGLSTTDVHVLHNGMSLFEADIDGYGGDPAFHAIQGASPVANYAGTLQLKAHDTVTFAVGYGKNHTHFGDTTGLYATVVLLTHSTK